MNDDEIWKIARECGLLTKQPGTNSFDNALFLFSRKLIEMAQTKESANEECRK